MQKRWTIRSHTSPTGIAHQEKEVRRSWCRSPELELAELAIDRSRARVLHISVCAGLEPCAPERGRPAALKAEGVWEVQGGGQKPVDESPRDPPAHTHPVWPPAWTRPRLRPGSLPGRKHAILNGECSVPGQHPLVRPGPNSVSCITFIKQPSLLFSFQTEGHFTYETESP